MKRGDPRVSELFSHLRRALDLLEDMARHPHQQSEPTPPPPVPPPAPIQQAQVAPSPTPMLVSIKDARKLIGVSHTRIYNLINEGALETILIGRRRMVRYGSLQKLSGYKGAE
jgi:hypothetical protein